MEIKNHFEHDITVLKKTEKMKKLRAEKKSIVKQTELPCASAKINM